MKFKKACRFKEELHYNDLIDGRTIKYLAQDLKYNRASLANILYGKGYCSINKAKRIVERCTGTDEYMKYFDVIEREESEG